MPAPIHFFAMQSNVWNFHVLHFQRPRSGHGTKHRRIETNWSGQRRLQDIVGERKLRFAGHVLRMAPERPAITVQ